MALVSFNLPIAKGNKIHCLDILHALVKHVLGHVEETDNFRQVSTLENFTKFTSYCKFGLLMYDFIYYLKLQDQMDMKFKKQFPTRKQLEIVSSTRIWKRQDKAARLIQKTYKDYVR